MEATLVPLALFLCIAYCVVGVTRAVTDARTRRKLAASGASAEVMRAAVGAPLTAQGHPAVRWGLALGAIGLALVIVQLLPYPPEDPLPVGLVLLFAALGLLGGEAASRRLARRDAAVVGPDRRPVELPAGTPAAPEVAPAMAPATSAARLGVGTPVAPGA